MKAGVAPEIPDRGPRADARSARSDKVPPSLYFETIKNLPVGVAILHLENSSDARTYRIVDLNAAAAELAGLSVESLRGRTLGEFPKVLEALDISNHGEEILRARRVINLDEFTYRDEPIRHGVYSVRIFPVSGEYVGVAIENVTEQNIAELSVYESGAQIDQRTVNLAKVNAVLRMEIAERRSAEEQLEASRDRLRALAARLQRVREEERIRIAREIHDELGQACTALKMDMALLAKKLSKKQRSVTMRMKSAIGLADGLIHSMRRIASDLRPRALDDLGLATALEWQAQEFENRTNVQCRVALPEEPLVLDADRSTAIFRIFQETLTNVARHSQATRVDVRLWKEEAQIVLQIQDNGKGFDSEEAKSRKSLGLIGMQERTILLNGTFQIEGSPGKGTTVTVRVPIS